MTNEELVEKYPVYEVEHYDFSTFREAITEPFPKQGTQEYDTFCQYGFTFGKGGIPFSAVLKQDMKTKEPYLDIVPCDKGTPHLTMTACSPEELPTPEAFRQKLEGIVNQAFLDGRLDAQRLEPYEYLNQVDFFDDFIGALQTALKEPPATKPSILLQLDIGDVRLSLLPCGVVDDDEEDEFYDASHLEMDLSILNDPDYRNPVDPLWQANGVKVCSYDIPEAIQQCRTSEAVRDFLNARLTAIVRKGDWPELDKALTSTEYHWMQYELHDAKELHHDAYIDHAGTYISCDSRSWTVRQREQYSQVLAHALLKETPSKTLWFKNLPDIAQNDSLTNYKLLGISEYSGSMMVDLHPLFDVKLENGNQIQVWPDEIFPSQMRLKGCPYTEKEYGIPMDLIPEPLQKRGIFGTIPHRNKLERKSQARSIVEHDIQCLFEKVQTELRLEPADITKLVHKAATAVQQEIKARNSR